MPNSYAKLYIHYVTAVKFREASIHPDWEKDLHNYMAGIFNNLDQFPIAINGMSDHVHLLFGLRTTAKPSEIIQKVKANSSRWINAQGFLDHKFQWQKGGGFFSVGYYTLDRTIEYVKNQKKHHQKISLEKEYLKLLDDHKVEFEDDYFLDFLK